MTPKEKAEELLNKFKPFAHRSYHGLTSRKQLEEEQLDNAKECALICVEEIMESQIPIHEFRSDIKYKNTIYYEYWNEVKQEIEKL